MSDINLKFQPNSKENVTEMGEDIMNDDDTFIHIPLSLQQQYLWSMDSKTHHVVALQESIISLIDKDLLKHITHVTMFVDALGKSQVFL